MNPKTFLTATVLTVVTTAAFGAASLRAPKLGGGATTTPAATTTMARAGTLRAQTMKTSMSTSTGAPTVTASISEPVATETTDARLSFLKGIKNLNSGKVKDTTAAQQELNNINAQIEELQSKLDAPESAQATVLTEDNIDDKITTSVESKTYTKAEIDNLLSALEKKLPKVDDKGNMTWTDPNGNLVAVPYHWINLVNQQEHLLLSYVQNQGWSSSPIADIFTYNTNKTDTEIATFVSNNTCKGETSKWCIVTGVTPLDNIGTKEVTVLRLRHGNWLIAQLPEYMGYVDEVYWTFEDSPKEYIKNMVCGERPENECNVNQYHTESNDALGEYYNVSGQIQETAAIRINKLVRYYMDFMWQSDFGIITGMPDMATSLGYETNMSAGGIREYVSSTICNDETPESGWCVVGSTTQHTSSGVPWTLVMVNRFRHGYKKGNVDYVTNSNTRVQNFVTIEDDASQYILNQICNNRPGSECHLFQQGQQNYCINLSDWNSPRSICVVYIEQAIEQ